ncbi:serine/threonine-protein kinase [Microbacterium sp.]|uniref:serine/threonine-protein kinase n=1 Tax=Microbacterium sp. TaxID=51671 RepID=UPI002E2F5731|nr:protein kinase [Microbacterium sp.]HEX5730164.1 protein kinase [Microbacterium sp.]
MSTPSTLVADRYRLVKMLGAGGMGVVWHAWDERLHRPVALKMLRTQPELTDPERELATDRAMREARITAGLHHPHAVTVFDVVEHEGQPCIVMQLIESTPLSILLREHGTMAPAETARIGAQVGSALAAAHKMRIVHRDVKPGNILITEDGSAMISDFGISHALGDATITATGMIHGTPAYLAPEVARGLPTSFASDVFSLGSTLYAMLEGEPPFGSEKNAIALLHKVARGGYPPPKHAGQLAPLLRQMLSPQPKRRPTMASVAEALSARAGGNRTGAVAVALAPASPVDGTGTDRIEDATTERLDDSAAERLEDATERRDDATTEQPDDATTERLDGATTERLDDSATERLEDATTAASLPATLALTEPRRPAAVDPTAQTIPANQPTRYEPPTAETERLVGSGARPAPEAGLPIPPSAPGSAAAKKSRGRTVGVVIGILAFVVAFVSGALLLFNTLNPKPDGVAQPETSRSATPTPVAGTPSSDATASPTTPTAPPPETTAPAPPPPTPEERVAQTVTGYYAALPGDIESAWPLMTADYQENHAGGRGAYEAFWGAIADVEVADVSVSAPDGAQATLTYYFRDGSVVQEVTAYRFVEEGGVLKIAATEVLSSIYL